MALCRQEIGPLCETKREPDWPRVAAAFRVAADPEGEVTRFAEHWRETQGGIQKPLAAVNRWCSKLRPNERAGQQHTGAGTAGAQGGNTPDPRYPETWPPPPHAAPPGHAWDGYGWVPADESGAGEVAA
ncbi:hypothetical protein ACFL59_10240 [Planctomycetota bacterium]